MKNSTVWAAGARCLRALGLASAAAWVAACSPIEPSAPLVKIAFVDPLSGPFGEVGRQQLRVWQWVAEQHNDQAAADAVRFQVVGFDNRGSPQESVNAIKVIIDQGFRYVVQGSSSGVAHLIVETLNRHNDRSLGREVLYLNYAAMDPALTNEQCSPWHFRVDADTSMKVEALALYLRDQPHIQKVFLLNQNYAHGQQVSVFFKAALARHRPDVSIVGDELHPLGSVQSFDAHVGRIQRSGAQAVVTGNWGPDLTGLVRAMGAADLNLPLFTYHAALNDTPKALLKLPRAEVYMVATHHSQHGGELGRWMREYQETQGDPWPAVAAHTGLHLLSKAMQSTGSTEPSRVGPVLAGLGLAALHGPVQMRRDDHQLQTGLWLSRWQSVRQTSDPGMNNSGFGFVPVSFLPAERVSQPTTCVMQRP